jgi:tetratricopeptide (TPR) repeat protein
MEPPGPTASDSAPPVADSPVSGPASPISGEPAPAERSAGPAPAESPSSPTATETTPTDPTPTDPTPADPTPTDPTPAGEGQHPRGAALPERAPDDAPPELSVDDESLSQDPIPVSGPPLATAPPGSPVAEASPDTVLPPPEGPAAGAATALRAPTMLTPIVQPDELKPDHEPTPPADAVEPPAADPEQVLGSYRWRFHHETLRELVEDPDELRAIRDRLTEKVEPAQDNRTRARLLSLRAVVSRILGDLGKALADGKLALAHAEATGELRRIAIAQARLAHVLQWRGDFAEADRLFEEANSSELPDRLRATMHEHAGRSCYDQGRYIEACNHFEKALELRKVEDPDLIARTELALDAVFSKVAQQGWGPYPRDRDNILQVHQPPVPTFSEKMQRWGYATPDGELAVAPSYADAQPFHDGVAWVRRPEARTWELIDESGEPLIGASAGYLGVGSFSDGLAWVSRDGTGGWVAIDKSNQVVIAHGCDDVRPFRRGIAAIRRGGWGAVDKAGRVLLPTRYSAFTTALTDGRYVDGFTDEGLAIVDAGGRKGVVDRAGRVIVPPAYPAMVIHPVAFLIGNGTGQWGALDRRGEPLIDPVHPSRNDVMDEIDRLLADTKPVL